MIPIVPITITITIPIVTHGTLSGEGGVPEREIPEREEAAAALSGLKRPRGAPEVEGGGGGGVIVGVEGR